MTACKHRWIEFNPKQQDLASSRMYKCMRCNEMRFVS